MSFLGSTIRVVFYIFTLLILVDVVISYFLSPYNAFRSILDKIVQPFLNPIRRILPSVMGFDLSPVILLLILQLVEYLLLLFVK